MPAVRRVVGQAYRRLGPAPACSRRERRWLLVIVVIAIALRLAWVLYAAREPRGFHDPTLYGVFAARIADGHGYTAANGEAPTYYPVGYIGALGAVVWVVGQTPIPENVSMTAAVFNLVLGVGAVALTFEVGRRLLRAAEVHELPASDGHVSPDFRKSLMDKAMRARPGLHGVAAETFVGNTADETSSSRNLAEGNWTRLGVGAIYASSDTFGSGRLWVLLLYAR